MNPLLLNYFLRCVGFAYCIFKHNYITSFKCVQLAELVSITQFYYQRSQATELNK